jgi:hypothetical protein
MNLKNPRLYLFLKVRACARKNWIYLKAIECDCSAAVERTNNVASEISLFCSTYRQRGLR